MVFIIRIIVRYFIFILTRRGGGKLTYKTESNKITTGTIGGRNAEYLQDGRSMPCNAVIPYC